jgi:hypothetical protein
MEPYKIVGTLGAFILAIGVFVPARFIKMVGYISYYTDHQTNGLILAALAVLALFLVFRGSPANLLTFGVLMLAAVAWVYLRHNPSLLAVEESVGQLTAQAAALPILRQTSASITANTPWWIMLSGSALLVVAGLMHTRRA